MNKHINPNSGDMPNAVNKWSVINPSVSDEMSVGVRVRITKQAPRLKGTFITTVEGIIVKRHMQKTGSWYMHTKDDRLWLDRLVIEKADKELYVCNIDPMTRIEVLETEFVTNP